MIDERPIQAHRRIPNTDSYAYEWGTVNAQYYELGGRAWSYLTLAQQLPLGASKSTVYRHTRRMRDHLWDLFTLPDNDERNRI